MQNYIHRLILCNFSMKIYIQRLILCYFSMKSYIHQEFYTKLHFRATFRVKHSFFIHFLHSKASASTIQIPDDPNGIDWSFYANDATYYVLLSSATTLKDYVDLAKLYPNQRSVIISDYLIRMYQLDEHDISIVIDGTENTYIADYKTGAQIATGLSNTLSTLQALGHLFQYLRIEIIDYALARDVSESIDHYCAKAAHEIVLHRNSSDHPTNFWFPRATRVILNYTIDFTDNIDLRMLFPRMSQLELLNTPYQPLLEREFQELTHFVFIPKTINTNPEIWRPFLKRNQQIRSFDSPLLWKFEFLKVINAELPNLETLNIKYLRDDENHDGLVNGTVRFKNVKTYSLDLMNFADEWNMEARFKLANIQFEKLETFILASDITKLADGWVELIGRNPTVNTVETKAFEIPYENLMRLSKLVQLRKLWLDGFEETTVADTKKFMSKKNKLTELAVCTDNRGRQELLKDLPSTWKVDADHEDAGKNNLLFRKK